MLTSWFEPGAESASSTAVQRDFSSQCYHIADDASKHNDSLLLNQNYKNHIRLSRTNDGKIEEKVLRISKITK